jgi:hypothetical protein
MAKAPSFKFYFNSEYLAAFKLPEDAYLLCTKYGEGSTIRYGHKASTTIYKYKDGDDYSYDQIRIKLEEVA